MPPPGPRLPYALQTLLIWGWPAQFERWCERRYGRVFSVNAYPGAMIVISDPEDIAACFAADPEVLRAGEANELLGAVLGERSILVSDGQAHLKRRRLMTPPFHGEAIARYAQIVRDVTREELAGWPDGELRVHQPMQRITLEVILRAVLGVEDADERRTLGPMLRRIVDLPMWQLLMWLFPRLAKVPPWRRVRARQQETMAVLDELIARRRRDPSVGERIDILSQLIGAMDDDGEARDQLMTLLIAGHETTATGLAWAFERLVRHPDVLARAERAAAEGDTAYLDALVKEALRVRPVIHDVARTAAQPIDLPNVHVPAGTVVIPSIGLRQGTGPFAPDPDRKYAASVWLPFGGGRRRCLGASFAQMEMREVIAEVLRARELEPTLVPDEKQRAHHITIVPSGGALVRSRRRAEDRPRPDLLDRAAPGVAA